MLWWASNDIRARRAPLALLSGVFWVAGVGRAVSGLRYGFSFPLVKVATAAELVGPPLVYLMSR